MRDLLAKKVPITALFAATIICAAVVLYFKVAVFDAPPHNAVLITRAGAARAGGTPSVQAAIPALGTVSTGTPTLATATTGGKGLAEVISTNATPHELAPSLPSVTPVPETSTPSMTPTEALVEVYVTGAVRTPGVYLLPKESRVQAALDAAGGALPGADLTQVNLAARVSDEEQIQVPRRGDTPIPTKKPTQTPRPTSTAKPPKTPTATKTRIATSTPAKPAVGGTGVPATVLPATGRVNINSAGLSDLETLPSIGPSLAQRIIDFRTANGPFRAIDDIMLVPGIKEGLFSKVKDFITVGP